MMQHERRGSEGAHGRYPEVKDVGGYGLHTEVQDTAADYGIHTEIQGSVAAGYGLQTEIQDSAVAGFGLQTELQDSGGYSALTERRGPGGYGRPQNIQDTAGRNLHTATENGGLAQGPLRSDLRTASAAVGNEYTTTEFRPLTGQLPSPSFSSPSRSGRSQSASPGRSASVSPRCRMIDVRATADKFWSNIGAQPHLYLQSLSTCTAQKQFPDNARPSVLQTKLKQRRNTLSSVVQPSAAVNLAAAPSSLAPDQRPSTAAPYTLQFSFSLVTAKSVGPTGLQRQRQPCAHVARVCMLDKASSHFIGNVWTIAASEVNSGNSTWTFNPADTCVVRYTPAVANASSGSKVPNPADVSLFIELNVSHKLTLEDAAIMPDSEHKASRMVDEVNTCWALINLQRCAELNREMEVAVPLYCSDMYSPTPLDQLLQQERKKHPVKSFFKPAKPAVLLFRAGPLPTATAPLMPFSAMPPTMVAAPDWGVALAAYQAALKLHQATHGTKPCSDPGLASFPKIMADEALMHHFMQRWSAATNLLHLDNNKGGLCCSRPADSPPTEEQVVALWRQLCMEVAPLLYSQALPPPHISNFLEYQSHRRAVIVNFTQAKEAATGMATGQQRAPVEPLSHAAFQWLHAPFDVREIRVVTP